MTQKNADSECSDEIPLDRLDPKVRPAFEKLPPAERRAWVAYFFPPGSRMPLLRPTRPKIIKWYCPFAHQASFPSGPRFCINTYTGCAHRCAYCYAASYEPEVAGPKRDFAKRLRRDLDDLERFDVPAAPLHLSNSTDPIQPLELKLGHTKLALEGLLQHRTRFSTVTVLTKNPTLAARPDYLALCRALGKVPSTHPAFPLWQANKNPAFQVEVSLAFWRESAAAFWDKGAPSIAARIAGIRALRAGGVPVVLRIDPLFPRSPFAAGPHSTLRDYNLEEAQTIEDLECLVAFAREIGARHVVYSPVKIVLPRGQPLAPCMVSLRAVYEAMARPQKLDFRGGSWRLPPTLAASVTEPFLALCRKYLVPAKFCMANVLETV